MVLGLDGGRPFGGGHGPEVDRLFCGWTGRFQWMVGVWQASFSRNVAPELLLVGMALVTSLVSTGCARCCWVDV